MAIGHGLLEAQAKSTVGVTHHLEGELVPVLHVELGAVPVCFERHVLLWKHPAVTVGLEPMAGAFKRMIAGVPAQPPRSASLGAARAARRAGM